MGRINQHEKALNKEQSKIRAIAVYKMLSAGEKLSCADISRRLYAQFGMTVSRKTIYDDIRAVDRIMPIECFGRGRNSGYKKMEV